MADRVAGAAYRTLYHITDGPAVLAELDALHALNFPHEWSTEPWPTRADEPGSVAIPDNWPYLTGDQTRAIAMRLGADNYVTAKEAEATIEAELARRAKAAAKAKKSDDE